jgi:hypothetical protein
MEQEVRTDREHNFSPERMHKILSLTGIDPLGLTHQDVFKAVQQFLVGEYPHGQHVVTWSDSGTKNDFRWYVYRSYLTPTEWAEIRLRFF